MKPNIDLGNVKLRNKVLITISCLVAFACVAAGLMNLYNGTGWLPVVIAELCSSVLFSYIALKTYRDGKKSWFEVAVVYGYLALIIFALISFKPGSSVIQWWYSVPVLSFFILPRFHGKLIAYAMLFFAIYIHVRNNLEAFEVAWNVGLVNLVMPYLMILGLANVYEKVRKQNEWELTEFALTDPLTKSYNRLALKSLFDSFNQSEHEYSLLLLDIDHFKQVNDNYGHDAGDHILTEFVQFFTNQLSNEQVFRIGGEEFLLIIEGAGEDAFVRAESLRRKILEQEYDFNGQRIDVSFSAGLVRGVKQASLSTLLKQADDLLYQAKTNGRNRIQS